MLKATAPIAKNVSRTTPCLEAFVRVAYPLDYKPGMLLGPFVEKCRVRSDAGEPILSEQDYTELRDLKDYAGRFHHDTNLNFSDQLNNINSNELEAYCHRVLEFTKRPV